MHVSPVLSWRHGVGVGRKPYKGSTWEVRSAAAAHVIGNKANVEIILL